MFQAYIMWTDGKWYPVGPPMRTRDDAEWECGKWKMRNDTRRDNDFAVRKIEPEDTTFTERQ